MDDSAKCIVEGTFRIQKTEVFSILTENDLDKDDPMIIRREINPQGKSRAFVNDTPVTLNILKELGDHLIDIHSQHQNISLTDSSFQFLLLDSYAGITEVVKNYRIQFNNYKNALQELVKLEEAESKTASEKDYFGFLLNELEKAKMQPGEIESLEHEQKILEHAEEIKGTLRRSSEMMNHEESGVIAALSFINKELSKLGGYDEDLKELADRINSSYIELEDIAAEIDKYEEQVGFDPQRNEEVTDRLNTLYTLLRKHQVATIEELFEAKLEIENKLQKDQSLQEQIKTLKKKLENDHKTLAELAGEISEQRKKIIKDLQLKTESILHALGMPNARFKIEIEEKEPLDNNGKNKIRFLFNANRGGALLEISSVASGGEKSRLMLAMKSLLSHRNVLPTIIFDEIDAGVSGMVADKVGDILEKLSESMQVIAITHLPQIAGKGSTHFLVFKEDHQERTQTFIKKLVPEERVMEIAKMMSGKKLSSATVESARDLLNN